ncbi:MAG: hypothetical protein WCA92_09975 [Terriglobales bacterium]
MRPLTLRTLTTPLPNSNKLASHPGHLLASICIVLVLALSASQFALAQYSINTIAGGGPNNLPATQSSLGYPSSVALDSAGNLYIANSYNSSQILEVSTTGTVTVVAGNGTYGYSGDGGPATSAALAEPDGVFVDGSGNIFIADTQNSIIREVVASTGNIQTVAGIPDSPGFSGDGTPATSAQLDEPASVALDSSGNIYIADSDNSVIRVVNTGSAPITIAGVSIPAGAIQTVAGTPGTVCATYPCGDGGLAINAQLDAPIGVSLDAQGNIYMADTFDSVIRVVNPSTQSVTVAGITISPSDINTVAGTYYDTISNGACQSTGDTGAATSAYLCLPFGVSVDASGNIFIADTDNFGIREVVPAGTINTVAGTLGTACASYSTPATACGNGGPATATGAYLNYPSGVTVDSSDDIYIADTSDFAVREVVESSGNITAFAGNSFLSYSGDGGSATAAELGFPGSTFLDASGNVYIADTYNQVIRVLNTGTSSITINGVTIAAGDIQTVAGDGIACLVPAPGGCGDGGLATSAQLNFPANVFLDASGNIYIADTGTPDAESSVIRVVNPSSSTTTFAGVSIPANSIATVAGTLGSAGFSGDGGSPISAQLFNPNAVAVDATGNIFIADTENQVIRVVNTGSSGLVIGAVTVPAGDILTVAGTPQTDCTTSPCGDGGIATSAYLKFPDGIALDPSDDILIADTGDEAIRVVNSGTQPITVAGTQIGATDILTVAGTIGQRGYSGDGGVPTSALLDEPWGVSLDSSGDIFIADTDNGAIREVVAASTTIQTIAGNGTLGFSGDGGTATSAMLDEPQSVAIAASGNVFIADTENSRIRELTPPAITVTVAPSTATVVTGALQQFTATVASTSNTAVTWSVNGVAGGNSTVGTIDPTGLYLAPATVPSSATVTITALSQADNTTTGTAQATIVAPSSVVTVTVSTNPPVTEVYSCPPQSQPCAPQPFIAAVTGSSNTAVTWYVEGAQGGDSTYGTIDTSGNYTGPATVPSTSTITIEAVSQADATAIGTEQVTIVAAPVAAPPPAQTVSPGGTATYSLSLNANTGNPHQPITLSCAQSSLPSGATCVFTPSTITPGSSAVQFSLAVTVPSSSASLQNNTRPLFGSQMFGSESSGPQSLGSRFLATYVYVAFIPLAGILLLGSKRKGARQTARSRSGEMRGPTGKHAAATSHTARWICLAFAGIFLLALIACGGSSSSSGSTTYTIKIQGTTTAQPNPFTITTANLTVQ